MPDPLVVHTPPPAPVMLPAKITLGLWAHTIWSGPAFAVGAGIMVTVIILLAAGHNPLPVEVSVNVTIPVEMSPALGL